MAKGLASLFSLGSKSIDTALSMKELVDKMHDVMRHINSLVGKHAAITDPLARGDMERQIADKLAILQDYTIKFGKAFLDRIDRNGLYVNKLISNMDVRTLFTRWQNPSNALDSYSKNADQTIQMFRTDRLEGMKKAYILGWFALQVKKSKNSNIRAAKRTVSSKIYQVKKLIEAKRKEGAKQNTYSHERAGALPIDYKKRIEIWQKTQQRQPVGARR